VAPPAPHGEVAWPPPDHVSRFDPEDADVPYRGPPAARGHLRLATAPVERRRRDSRVLLLVRALGAAIALVAATVVAWFAIALALAPLLWRRAPVRSRLRPLRAREARVIRLEPRRKALS
jgi:hypothetical protein